MKKILLLTLFLFTPRVVFAACTSSPTGDLPGWGTTVTLSSCNKTISGTTGVDRATSEGSTTNTGILTLSGTTSLTINNGGHLVVGSLNLGAGTTISLASTADIKTRTPLYIPDADADGWSSTVISSATIYTATASGRRRLGLMHAWTADCGDSQYATNNVCCTVATYYQDADGDGTGNPSVSQSICPTSGWVSNSTDCNDTGTNAANVSKALTCYVDTDNDNYGAGTVKSCITAGATCGTATWASGAAGTTASSGNFASTNTDCYTSNANAYPGSLYCSTASRGDGSFDYDCSGTSTACNPVYYGSSYYANMGGGDPDCYPLGSGHYDLGAVASCGASGSEAGVPHSGSQSYCNGGGIHYGTYLGAAGTQSCQ